MKKYIKQFLLLPLIFLSFFDVGNAQQITIGTPSSSVDEINLESLVVKLADFKSLKKKSRDLDVMFDSVCKKTRYFKDESGVDAEFSCDEKKLGVSSVEYYTVEVANSPNYLMYFRLYFSYGDFSRIKQAVAKKLGPPTRKNPNYWIWRNKSDKFLNDRGNPVISVSADKSNSSAIFSLLLEQGDSER